jgi:outer membrane protein assembly factor BamB
MSENFATNKMKILSSRSTGTAIALVLMLSMVVSLAASVQTVKAADITTYTFIAANANPIGVDQTAFFTVWLNIFPPSHSTPTGYVADALWNFTVTITDPSGNVQTRNVISDLIGGATFNFVPTVVGNYSYKATFNENSEYVNTYLSSTSSTHQLVVQQQPIPTWPAAPLPTNYWTRPIYGENREWGSITGDWLMRTYDGSRGQWASSAAFNPYTIAPNTAHIMWTKQLTFGGVVGGQFADQDYYTGLQYQTKFDPSIIMNGRLYYNLPLGDSPIGGGFVCVDLRTGEQLWWQNGTITNGQELRFETMNQHGIIPYLWDLGTRDFGSAIPHVDVYTMYDAFTGQKILSIPNASLGTYIQGVIQGDAKLDTNGNLLVYFIGGSSPNLWLAMWNSTICIQRGIQAGPATFGSQDPDYWRPLPTTKYTWADGIQWNVTVPDVGVTPNIERIDLNDSVIWARAIIGVQGAPNATVVEVGYDATTGAQLWVQNRTGDEALMGSMADQNAVMRDGVYTVFKEETKQWYAYDDHTGRKLWETEPIEGDWGMYAQGTANIAYGKFYVATYEGKVHAYDLKTGTQLWEFYVGSSGLETPYGSWPIYWWITIADGKIFATNGEHSPNSPLYRGERLYVIDAETGKGLWNVSGWFQAGDPAISDGYYVALNGYDMQIYCFGKGPSATTVLAPETVQTLGTDVLIKGTVTDESAGTKQSAQAALFPHGVPAIADKDMTAWMEYLYEQKPMPTNATGVPVTLDVIDANGNYRNIGNTTSDMNGFYSFEWQPDIPGKYTVIATFIGSESYYASYSETAFTVSEAPPATPTPTPLTLPPYETYTIAAAVAVIIAIAIATLLLLRKRP